MAITYKNMSIHKWNGILKDFPEVTCNRYGIPEDIIYGKCGYCEKRELKREPCIECPLYPKYCSNFRSDALFWQICDKLKSGDTSEETREMIVKMLKRVSSND
jgi:hypothetical protein